MTKRITNPRRKRAWSRRLTSPISDMAYGLMRQRADNQKVLTAILKAFPECRTKMTSIVWYRGRLRKLDKNILGQREVTSPAARAKINAGRLAKWRASEYAQTRRAKGSRSARSKRKAVRA